MCTHRIDILVKLSDASPVSTHMKKRIQREKCWEGKWTRSVVGRLPWQRWTGKDSNVEADPWHWAILSGRRNISWKDSAEGRSTAHLRHRKFSVTAVSASSRRAAGNKCQGRQGLNQKNPSLPFPNSVFLGRFYRLLQAWLPEVIMVAFAQGSLHE